MDRGLSNDLRGAVSDRVDEAAPPARKHGDRPIGVRTGNLALRIAEYGEVRVRKG
jgi:hypothetical protein